MTKQEFLTELQEELEIEQTLKTSTNLKELDEWDSMTAMLLIGYVSENFDVNLTPDGVKKITTIDSLIEVIGTKKFD